MRVAATFDTNAASGIAVVHDAQGAYVASANYYGASSIYRLDHLAGGPRLQEVQTVATTMAHDFARLELPTATQLLVSNFGAEHSLVLQLNDSSRGGGVATPLPPPPCVDASAKCVGWAASGECERNRGYMAGTCARSCAACGGHASDGPWVPVQRLPTTGASAALHFVQRNRHFLAIANYGSQSGKAVAIYEWDGAAAHWRLFYEAEARGTAELAHCAIPGGGGDLLVFATWFDGAFGAMSHVVRIDAEADPPVTHVQSLPTAGSHDAECLRVPRHGGADELLLVLASGRDDRELRALDTVVYSWEGVAFRERQRLPSVGAHDVEVLGGGADGRLALAIANQGGGNVCNGTVDVWDWSSSERTFTPAATLRAGCAVYVSCWLATPRGKGWWCAVAVEREGANFTASSLVVRVE